MIRDALDSGMITVYSSYPIENGVFVCLHQVEVRMVQMGIRFAFSGLRMVRHTVLPWVARYISTIALLKPTHLSTSILILWASYRNLENSGTINRFLFEAEDVAIQSKLKVGNYSPIEETQEDAAEDLFREDDIESANSQFNDELNKQINENQSISEENVSDGGASYREVDDEQQIEWLEKQPTVKVYRSMALIDGKLYPPMNSIDEMGELGTPEELGKWTESVEHPENAFEKNGKWYFNLKRNNGGKTDGVAYNPYIHTSTTMLNDQFAAAQSRPELVVVETEVPSSSLIGTYKAERAHDPTGAKPWNAGTIQKQLTGKRDVILSRWAKPVRIVPNSEVAAHIYDMVKDHISVMPSNVVTPQVRAEMEKLGMEFVETNNNGKFVDGVHKGQTWTSVYGKQAKKKKKQKAHTREDNTRKMHERAVELGNSLGVKVRLVESRSELPQSWTDTQKRRRKGWFNQSTGEVVIVVPNHNSVADVEATVLHEIVGHKGLRELFGEDFNTFLDNVLSNADATVRQRIEQLAATKYNNDMRKATEEYLAGLAETTNFEDEANRKLWAKVKEFFMNLLRKAGIRLAKPLSDADLRYILWRSYQNLQNKGPLGVAENVVMREELGIDGETETDRYIDDMTDDEIVEHFRNYKLENTPRNSNTIGIINSESDIERLRGMIDDEDMNELVKL